MRLDRKELVAPALFTLGLLACRSGGAPAPGADDLSEGRLPTGVRLDPAGSHYPVGQFPLAMVPSPDGTRLVLLLNGYRDQGVQLFDLSRGQVSQTLLQPAAFLGVAFDHPGKTLFASGGDQDVVYRYSWSGGQATLKDSLALAAKDPKKAGTRYPGGLALSDDDRLLYVAENLADSLAVIQIATGRVMQRLPAGRYPYAVAVAADGTVWVSAWGGYEVRSFRTLGEWLEPAATVRVGRHPSALLLNRDGSRLYVASASTDRVSVVDTRAGKVVGELVDTVPGGTGEGSTPNALALSADERLLFVAEADNNAVAVFELSPTGGRLLGRIPVGWYPAAVLLRGDTMIVANGKGRGTAANKDDGPGPGRGRGRGQGYTLSQLGGSLSVIPLTRIDSLSLAPFSGRVARANGWTPRGPAPAYPPFEHVIYLVKENRTYDQVFGDLPQGDGDSSLVFFPRAISPNHHALAERFGLFDRFFVNAEVSADGHNWTMAGYVTDYTEKTLQQNYSGRGRSYDFQGENRGVRPPEGEDAAEPSEGYLWDLAKRRGISFRNFGEFVTEREQSKGEYEGLKPFLEAHTEPGFPGFDMHVTDQHRADLWLAALARWEREGTMPALQILYLPNDHTMGGAANELTPRAYMADNDLALGRVIEGLSRSRFWRSTVVFVLEDDAQNGPDHVDSHRSPMLVISAWSQPGRVWHRFANTTDVLATIEEILTLEPLSQYDAFGRPLRGIFPDRPDLSPYAALQPANSLTERNPRAGPGSQESAALDFSLQDRADDDAFNRALWLTIKGMGRPYPGAVTRSSESWRHAARP